jgi:hypothetical protein
MLKIEFRNPQTDRFIEILACMEKAGFKKTFHVYNAPKGLNNFLDRLLHPCDFVNIKEADYVHEYLEQRFGKGILREQEPIEQIIERIHNFTLKDYNELPKVSEELLKMAQSRLSFNLDQLQNCLDMAMVIASMDNSDKICPEHTSEAIHYVKREVSDDK